MGVVPLCVGGATAVVVLAAALLGHSARPYRPSGDAWGSEATTSSRRYITAAAALANVGILWQGLTFLFLPPCP